MITPSDGSEPPIRLLIQQIRTSKPVIDQSAEVKPIRSENDANKPCVRASTRNQTNSRQPLKKPLKKPPKKPFRNFKRPPDQRDASHLKKKRIDQPQLNVLRQLSEPIINDHSYAKPPVSSQETITSFNDIQIKDIIIKIRPIEQILKKGNGKFLNSCLLDKMFSQARIDTCIFAAEGSSTEKEQVDERMEERSNADRDLSTREEMADRPEDGEGRCGQSKQIDRPANNAVQAKRANQIEQPQANMSSNVHDQYPEVGSSVSCLLRS